MSKIVRIKEKPYLLEKASMWFSEKWSIPIEAYQESINDSFLTDEAVPNWYIYIDKNENIIGGCGIIENDFHNRVDLKPNLCALYVEKNHRNQGIAAELLDYAIKDSRQLGIQKMYLLTDLEKFYESKGWKFFTNVIDDDGYELKVYSK